MIKFWALVQLRATKNAHIIATSSKIPLTLLLALLLVPLDSHTWTNRKLTPFSGRTSPTYWGRKYLVDQASAYLLHAHFAVLPRDSYQHSWRETEARVPPRSFSDWIHLKEERRKRQGSEERSSLALSHVSRISHIQISEEVSIPWEHSEYLYVFLMLAAYLEPW